jgi:rod shape-determining protein MreC
MYQRRRARGLLVLLVLVSLTLVTIDFRSGDEGPLSSLRRIVTTVFAPVQSAFASAVRPIGDGLSAVGDTFDARSELAQLRTQVEELDEAKRSFSDLARENEQLRSLLGMRDSVAASSVTARVVGQSSSDLSWTVTIDVGTNDGVELDMVVVNGNGLVGRILQVTDNASRVLLAIDPNFSAAARDAAQGETGLVTGQGGDLMRYRPLDPEAFVALGGEIVTSGYSNGVFPPGIPIGEVEQVGQPDALLDRELRIRPYVDFSRLDFVLIVLQPAIAPPPENIDGTELRFTPPFVRDTGSRP